MKRKLLYLCIMTIILPMRGIKPNKNGVLVYPDTGEPFTGEE